MSFAHPYILLFLWAVIPLLLTVYWGLSRRHKILAGFAAGEGLQLQVRAKDKAGNYGAGYSKVLFVSGYTEEPTPQQAADQATEQPANSPTNQPADIHNQQTSASPMPRQIISPSAGK